MGLFRKLGSFLGFVKDESEELKDEEEKDRVSSSTSVPNVSEAAAQHLPRKGFSVSVQVPVDKPAGPLLVPCSSGDGGVQVKKLQTFQFSFFLLAPLHIASLYCI